MTASLALLRVHVLVVELPGRSMLRLRAEAAVRARGWVPVVQPADADLVLVCGTPVPSVVAAVDALWSRVPAPRVRRTVRTAEALTEALDSAARVLADTALQRRAAADAGARGSGGTSRPAEADPRTVAFGPVGPDWPAGLRLDCTVGHDGRIAAVGTRRLRAMARDESMPDLLAVADAARLLRLAGWAAPALRLDRIVDRSLGGADLDRRRVRSVAAQVRRSATLRWAIPALPRERILALLLAAADGAAGPTPAERVLIGARVDAVPLLVAATEPVDG